MSQLIFNDGTIKSRLIQKDTDWFVAEWKEVKDAKAEWFPWVAGTSDFLCLTPQEREWAVKKGA